MKPHLAQCPFCFARTPEVASYLLGFQVICKNCMATGPSKHSKQEALLAWNALSEELARSRQWYANDFASKLKQIEESMGYYTISRRVARS